MLKIYGEVSLISMALAGAMILETSAAFNLSLLKPRDNEARGILELKDSMLNRSVKVGVR